MTQGSEQGTLEAFDGGGGAPDRPAAEAAAVTSPDAAAADVVDRLERRFPEVDDHVECSVTQVDYTVEGDGDDERPVLHVHGRTADREPVHARVHDFRPYFYTPVTDLDVAVDADAPLSAVDVVDSQLEDDRLTGVETYADRPGGVPDDRSPGEVVVYESIRGEELVKLFGQTPRDVGELRDRFEHYEADILFPNRLMIDKDVKSGVRLPARERDDGSLEVHHTEIEPVDRTVEPRVHTLDIEVDDRNGFPEDGEQPIICLTSHDSYRDEYVVWLYESPQAAPGPDAVDDYEAIGDGELDVDVRGFDDEARMLADYLAYVETTDPDVLTGWNFDDFDAPYLIDRIERLERRADGLEADRLSRVGEVWHSGWGGPDVKGRVVFDLLYAYQRTQFSELDSYRLDAVGEAELGVGKERYPGDIGDLWEDDPEQLLEYNLRDVELCVELDRKQDIVPFWREVAAFVGCKLEDATTPGDAVDMYVLHETHGEFALPSKGQQEGEEYEGGAVFDPISGVREMVSVLDLKSLYPMAMTTINASPETKVDPDSYDGNTYIAPNGTHFRKEPDGMIRSMVDELLEEREDKKALRNDYDPGTDAYETYDRQQAAVKVIMNCFTPDTDVLTPDGVHNIRDLEVGDEVYSLDPETMEMEVKPVVETHAYPDYRGELVDIETSKIDFSVTPNHRMVVRKNDKNGITDDGWSFVEAGDLYDYCHYELPYGWEFEHQDELPDRIDLTELIREHTDVELTFADGGTKLAASCGEPNVSRQVPVDDLLELLAWYISEGDVYEAKTGNYRVKIAQEDEEALDRIAGLAESFVEYYYATDRKVSFSSRPLAELFEELCGAGSRNKRIPDLVFEGSKEQKEQFLDDLIAGDGDRQPNSWRYSTKSEALRDDVLKLCTHLGITATYSSDSGVWRLYCAEEGKNSFRMHRDGSQSTAENGVYCVTVEDNNTLVAGRNGKLHNVSNSLYGVLGWDRFRLYDKEMGAAVTATGRDVIEFTEDAANDVGYEVAYGDSVTGDRPVVVRDPDERVHIVRIKELFGRGEPSPGEDVLVTADGGPAASVETGKEYGLLDGWEALSMATDGTAEWQPIEGVMRHQTDKPVVRLQHKFGESTTTRDHSYVVEEGDEYVEATPEAVEEPLRIPDLPIDSAVDVIDVYEVLDGYEREYEDGRGTGGTTTKTKRVHANDEFVWFGHEHYDELDSTVKVQRYVDPGTEDCAALCRLLAAYVTEGSATTAETASAKFGASIAESRREWLEGLEADYHRLFENTTASVNESDRGGERTVDYETAHGAASATYDDRTWKLQMMNELAAVFFREFAGQTSRGTHIPSFVYHLPDDEQRLFLETLVEGDDSREFPRSADEYAERNFEFETTSRELAAGLSMLLTQRGEKHSLKYRESKDSYTVRTVESYRRGREPVRTEAEHDGYVYDLSVAENDNFVDAVGGIVLHNTDSVMLELGSDVTKKDAVKQSFEIEEHLNDAYDEFATELNADEHRFEIEFEKLYRRFFQAGKKKRYAGHKVWSEGKDVDDLDITGFEYKRSDIAPLTKEVQKEVLEMIVTGTDREEITDYVHDVIQRVRAGDVSLEEIGIPGGIGKKLDNYETDTAQVRGAKYANLLFGTNFASGSKPKRLYLEKVHPEFFRRIEAERGLDPAENALYGEFKRDPDVICFEFDDQVPEAFEVDYDKMLDKTLKGPIARVLSALDISWEEAKSGQEQTGLGSFV